MFNCALENKYKNTDFIESDLCNSTVTSKLNYDKPIFYRNTYVCVNYSTTIEEKWVVYDCNYTKYITNESGLCSEYNKAGRIIFTEALEETNLTESPVQYSYSKYVSEFCAQNNNICNGILGVAGLAIAGAFAMNAASLVIDTYL